MDIGDWLFSANCTLNEQIAKQIFDVLPEDGLIMVIMDREGRKWVSAAEDFSKLNISESFMRELRAKIDDGTEPIITQTEDCSVVAAGLSAEQTQCGYVIIFMPQYSPESTLANIDLIETVLNQAGLIARLIEQCNMLHELQMKQLSSYTQSEISSS